MLICHVTFQREAGSAVAGVATDTSGQFGQAIDVMMVVPGGATDRPEWRRGGVLSTRKNSKGINMSKIKWDNGQIEELNLFQHRFKRVPSPHVRPAARSQYCIL